MNDFIKSDGKLFVNTRLLPESKCDIISIPFMHPHPTLPPPHCVEVHMEFEKRKLVDGRIITYWWEYIGYNGEQADHDWVIKEILRMNKKRKGSTWTIGDEDEES